MHNYSPPKYYSVNKIPLVFICIIMLDLRLTHAHPDMHTCRHVCNYIIVYTNHDLVSPSQLQVNAKWSRGDGKGARRAANLTKLCNAIGIIFGTVCIAGGIVGAFIGGVFLKN